jgi:hypothetical protein
MAAADEELDRAGRLIERLLVDADFRAAFRRNPAAACEAAGLESLAADFAAGGSGMQTLELRESKSSLAGVIMAVAAEGVAVAELQGLLHGHGLGAHGPARAAELKALRAAHVKTPHGAAARALEHQLKAHGTGAKGASAGGASGGSAGGGASGGSAGGGAGGAGSSAGADGSAGGAGAGAAAAGGAGSSGAAGGSGSAAAGAGGAAAGGGAGGAGPAAAAGAGAGGGAASSSAAAPGGHASGAGGHAGAAGGHAGAAAAGAQNAPAGGGAAGATAYRPGGGQGGGSQYAPPGSGTVTPQPGAAGGGAATGTPAGGGAAAPAAGATPAAGAASAAGAVPGVGTAPPGAGAGAVPTAGDPAAAGAAQAAGAALGSASPGGAAATVAELLQNPRLAMAPQARALLATGSADPRLLGILSTTLQHHTIAIGDIEAITDPVHAQAIDITAVDGQPIDASNVAARDLITEIAALDPSTRPNEIGTPWPIQSPGFFTDATHQNRLHLAFTSPADYQPGATPAAADVTPAAAAINPAAAGAAPSSGPTPIDPAAAGAAQAAQQAMQTPAPPAAPAPQPAPAGSGQGAAGQVIAGQVAAGQGAAGAGGASAAAQLLGAGAAARAAGGQASGGGAAAAIAYARSMIGKLPESSGPNLGPALDKFEAQYGFHGAPWCGIFAGHALQAAGLQVPHSVASVASILQLAQSGTGPFEKGILPVSAIRPGDLVTFGGTEHVALVTSVDGQGVHTIAGNTSQSNVSETTYSPSEVTGVVRPKYGPAPQHARVMAAIASAGAGGAPAGGAAAALSSTPPGTAPGAPPGAPPPAAGTPPGAPPGTPGTPPGTPPADAAPPQPGTAVFHAVKPEEAAAQRHTVQFDAAVVPPPDPSLQPPPVPGAAQAVPGQPVAAVPQAGALPATPGGAAEILGQAAGGASPSGAMTVSSSLLTSGQEKFVARLSELTGLNPRVAAAWCLAEESGSAATGRQAANNYNWLNIGYFDSGAGRIAFDQAFSNPVSAAEQTAKFLEGKWGGASSSIRAILSTVHQDPQAQIMAIANSDWASSHYGGGANLRGTFDELANMQVRSG